MNFGSLDIKSWEAMTATISIAILMHRGDGYCSSATTEANIVVILAITLHNPKIVELKIVGTRSVAAKKNTQKAVHIPNLVIAKK